MKIFDTNICIALLKDNDKVLVKKIRENPPSEYALCSIVKAELIFGARNSNRVDQNLAVLEKFFKPFQSFVFDDVAAEHYGLMRAALSRAGQPIGANDMMIAAIALANDATVITRNRREFARVAGLRWEEW